VPQVSLHWVGVGVVSAEKLASVGGGNNNAGGGFSFAGADLAGGWH
jgi:hypothetical protein